VNVSVRWHESTHDDLEAWVEDQPARDPDRRLLTQNSLDELVRLLEATGGIPSNAVRIEGAEPPAYWWMYYDDLWLQYAVREDRRQWWNLFGGPQRRVTILRVLRHRPERFEL
jgi:hypothetical protein